MPVPQNYLEQEQETSSENACEQMRHPYLKILDQANLFVADAPMKKKSRNFVLPPSQSTLKYGSENRPCLRGLILDRGSSGGKR